MTAYPYSLTADGEADSHKTSDKQNLHYRSVIIYKILILKGDKNEVWWQKNSTRKQPCTNKQGKQNLSCNYLCAKVILFNATINIILTELNPYEAGRDLQFIGSICYANFDFTQLKFRQESRHRPIIFQLLPNFLLDENLNRVKFSACSEWFH